MLEYIEKKDGTRTLFGEYLLQLRQFILKTLNSGAEKRAKEAQTATQLLFAALNYKGNKTAVSEGELKDLVKEQTTKAVLLANREALQTITEKQNALHHQIGVPGYLSGIYSYGFDYSGTPDGETWNDRFEKYADDYGDKGINVRGYFAAQSIQKILDLKDSELVPENEAAARDYIVSHYHELHLAENIDSMLEKIGNEFDIIGPDEYNQKESERTRFNSRSKRITADRETILDTLHHKQKLIQNLLLHEKQWIAQENPQYMNELSLESLTPTDEKPDPKYDGVQVNMLNLAQNKKGRALQDVGKELTSTGYTLDELEELARARLTDRKLEEMIKGGDPDDAELERLTEEIQSSLKDEDVYAEMKRYARQVAIENKNAEKKYKIEAAKASGDRTIYNGLEITSAENRYEQVKEENTPAAAAEFMNQFVTNMINDSHVSDLHKFRVYEMAHDLLNRFKDDLPGNGDSRSFRETVDALEKMAEIGPKFSEHFDKDALEQEIDRYDSLAFKAEQREKERKVKDSIRRSEYAYREKLREQGIDLNKKITECRNAQRDTFEQYRYAENLNGAGFAVTEAFGNTADKAHRNNPGNQQAFDVSLALLSYPADQFPSKGDAFKGKIEFIHNMLTDPDFREKNKTFVNNYLSGSVMQGFEKVANDFKKDPNKPECVNKYANMLCEASKTINTLVMVHPELSEKVAILANAVQNIQHTFYTAPKYAPAKNLAETDKDYLLAKKMNEGVVALADIGSSAMTAKADIMDSPTPDKDSLGKYFAGEIAKLAVKNDDAKKSPLFKNGEYPVSRTLLLLSSERDGKKFADYISDVIENTPSCKIVKEKGYMQFREMLIKDSPDLQKLTERIFAETVQSLPKSLADEVQNEAKAAEDKAKEFETVEKAKTVPSIRPALPQA